MVWVWVFWLVEGGFWALFSGLIWVATEVFAVLISG